MGTDNEIDDYDDNYIGVDDAHGMLELDRSLSGNNKVNCVGERSAEKRVFN
jgi:hypothetical protein